MSAKAFLLVFGIVSAACAHGPAIIAAGAPEAVAGPSDAKATEPAAGFWSDTIRPLEKLGKGWNRIPGRFGTGCAHDSAFSFKVHPGLTEKVAIILNGGGACWRAQDCDPKNHPTYTMIADSANDISARTGLFDVNNEKNPIRDYTIVFVPYCTGDLHLGSRQSEYEWHSPKNGDRNFLVRHGGAANIEAVLDWVFVNVRNPRTVFVAGMSTGAVASPVIAEKVARHYPRARVVQLGDGAGGYRSVGVAENMWRWGATEYLQRDPGFRSLDSAQFTFEQLYVTASHVAPRVHFAQVNSADDATQINTSVPADAKTSPAKRLSENLSLIRDDVPWFRTFTSPGRAQTILKSSSMYTLTVDGVKFVDWLTELLDGDDVADVGGRLVGR